MISFANTRVRIVGAAATAALVTGVGVAIAPSAMAVPDSAVISSLDPGPIGVSGTVTFSPIAPAAFLNVTIGFPMSQYSTSFTGDCVSNGITVAINGIPLAAACAHGSYGSLYNTLDIYNYWSSPSLSTTDVITVTWGPTALTRTGSSNLDDFAVSADLAGQGFIMVTPTVAGASAPSGAASGPDLTVWHQSLGRATADEACPSGYSPSWAQWPNGHLGGWVCNRELHAYPSNAGS